VRNPLTSEQGAFQLLLWVGGVALVIALIVVLVRAL
jgi:hypothetical protein